MQGLGGMGGGAELLKSGTIINTSNLTLSWQALFGPILSLDVSHPVEPEDLKCSVEDVSTAFMDKAKALQVRRA